MVEDTEQHLETYARMPDRPLPSILPGARRAGARVRGAGPGYGSGAGRPDHGDKGCMSHRGWGTGEESDHVAGRVARIA